MRRKGREISCGAVFSRCRVFRYVLTRDWSRDLLSGTKKTILFVMLNPSKADETKDDPTIRRCIDFAIQWGYNRLEVVNLFSYRATMPNVMRKNGHDSVGPLNDQHIIERAKSADKIICAWGNHGTFLNRGFEVAIMLSKAGYDLYALGFNDNGTPVHPLMLKKTTVPEYWPPQEFDMERGPIKR